MSEHFLEELGLTRGEIRVYLSLLSLGQTTSGPLIAESHISSSKVYEILDKLMKKGLATHIIKNKTKYFQATSPAKLRTYLASQEHRIEQQKNELEKNLPGLLALYHSHRISENAEIFTGLPAIKTMLWDMIEDAKPGEHYLFFGGVGKGYEKIFPKLYISYDTHRHEKKLTTRGLVSSHHQKLLAQLRYAKIRYVTHPTPSNIGIFRDKIAIQSWSEKPMAVLITSQELANQFREFFETVWTNAKAK